MLAAGSRNTLPLQPRELPCLSRPPRDIRRRRQYWVREIPFPSSSQMHPELPKKTLHFHHLVLNYESSILLSRLVAYGSDISSQVLSQIPDHRRSARS